MKIRIEMEIPNDVDPSEVLHQCQEMAIEFFDNVAGDVCDEFVEMIENEVSVEVLDHTTKFVPVWHDFAAE